MRFIVLALAIASTVATLHPVSREIVNEIKAKADTWTPMEPEENPFAYMSIEQIKGMMGYKRSPKIFTSQKDRVSAPDTFLFLLIINKIILTYYETSNLSVLLYIRLDIIIKW